MRARVITSALCLIYSNILIYQIMNIWRISKSWILYGWWINWLKIINPSAYKRLGVFLYKMQIKYEKNAPDFMIRKHKIFFSNTIFWLKVMKTWSFSKLVTLLRYLVQFEVHFEIFGMKLSYNTFIILIMFYIIWEINFNYISCH